MKIFSVENKNSCRKQFGVREAALLCVLSLSFVGCMRGCDNETASDDAANEQIAPVETAAPVTEPDAPTMDAPSPTPSPEDTVDGEDAGQ